jgi:hypothetical protein
MTINTSNTPLQDFLIIISSLSQFEKKTILINYEVEITGTLNQLKECATNIDSIDLNRFIYNLNQESLIEISDIEIYNYLKELTNNFNNESIKIALNDFSVFENMVLDETLNELSEIAYYENDWQIPQYTKYNERLKENVTFYDYEKMKNKVFPLYDFQFQYAKNLLINKLTTAVNPIKKNSQIFNANIQQEEITLSSKINNHFAFLLGASIRNGQPILKEEVDLKNLVKWTTSYYESDFKVPEITDPIKYININKTYTQLAFFLLFDELRIAGFHKQTQRAKTLYPLWINCFAEYTGYKERNFWKVSQRDKNLIKKLMKIEH